MGAYEAEKRASEVHGESCDLCAVNRLEKPAVDERSIGHVWVYVCEAHAYRIDSATAVRS